MPLLMLVFKNCPSFPHFDQKMSLVVIGHTFFLIFLGISVDFSCSKVTCWQYCISGNSFLPEKQNI
jgi:hypothetical protein